MVLVEPWETGVFFRSFASISPFCSSQPVNSHILHHFQPIQIHQERRKRHNSQSPACICILHRNHPASVDAFSRRTAPLLPPLKVLVLGRIGSQPFSPRPPAAPTHPSRGNPNRYLHLLDATTSLTFFFSSPFWPSKKKKSKSSFYIPSTSVIVAAVDSIYVQQELAT